MPLSYRRTMLDGQPLHPTTQMVSFGYDPSLSEGAVKPPVFLTSTFAFRSAEEGAEFFDVVAGRNRRQRAWAPAGSSTAASTTPTPKSSRTAWRSSTARRPRS